MKDKVVLVTGGAKRVGAAICRRLHQHGAKLVVHYHSSYAEAQHLRQELEQSRPSSVALAQANLLETAQIPAMIDYAVRQFGQLDAVVNNASSFFTTPIGTYNESTWQDLVGSNLKAPLFLSQAAAPFLRQQQGSIVNIIDIHAEYPLKHYAIYNAAKGGLASLTRSLAVDLAPQIRVNGVSPGPILWPEGSEWQEETVRNHTIGRTLLKRMGEPEDIARTVSFLIADAPYITGQIIVVDGGRSINL
ncbi:MAG: pteridine reductase [Nitrosomonas sp.]|nr:pteridine reductase [Nitrosomonas sp.]